MGFADVKVDGLIVEELKNETQKYNNIYFGEGIVPYNQSTQKGQLEKFEEAQRKYSEQQFAPVKNYFLSLKWDYKESNGVHTFRANDSVSVSYKCDKEYYIEFRNGEVRKTYGIEIQSDFQKNPYYSLDTNSRAFGGKRYQPKGGEATQPQMIKERLEEIKAVVEHNESLKGNYNFRIMVDKKGGRYHAYESEIKWVAFDSVMDVINEISDEYF